MAAAAGTTPTSKTSLWDQATDLSPYDILILSCEGQETRGDADGGGVSVAEQTALRDFTNAGGRAFLSHFHYSFLDTGPFANPPLAAWTAGANPIEDQGGIHKTSTLGDIVTTLPDGGKFAKGEAFYQWLGVTDSLTGTQLQIVSAKNNALVTAADTPSQTWIAADQNAVSEGAAKTTSAAGATEYFTFDTPIGGMGTDEAGAPIYCGRVVFSDLHVGGASGDYPGQQTRQRQPHRPHRLRRQPPFRAGKGARIHALRPLVVRDAGHEHRPATPADRAPQVAGRRLFPRSSHTRPRSRRARMGEIIPTGRTTEVSGAHLRLSPASKGVRAPKFSIVTPVLHPRTAPPASP